MMENNDLKQFIELLDFSHGKYDTKTIFKDIVSLETYFIQAAIMGQREYGDKFNELMKKYTLKEQEQMKKNLIELTSLYCKQVEPVDILGEIYNRLQFYNKNTGQFFTPTYVSDMMAKIMIDVNDIEKTINEFGYISVHEPCAGAGGLILSYAKELKAKGYNPSKYMYVNAWDIDVICTYMTYIQLFMYDIPATVVCGDTLSLKENFVLNTPLYYRAMERERKTKNGTINQSIKNDS